MPVGARSVRTCRPSPASTLTASNHPLSTPRCRTRGGNRRLRGFTPETPPSVTGIPGRLGSGGGGSRLDEKGGSHRHFPSHLLRGSPPTSVEVSGRLKVCGFPWEGSTTVTGVYKI